MPTTKEGLCVYPAPTDYMTRYTCLDYDPQDLDNDNDRCRYVRALVNPYWPAHEPYGPLQEIGYWGFRPGPEVIKLFSSSAQLSMKFHLLINVEIVKISGKFRFKTKKKN